MNPDYSAAISQIKDKLDIVQVISEYVILKRAGRNYQGLCPFHKEKTPSFSVNPQKQIYKCFGCGEAGDAIAFLMKINNQSFNEVITDLAQKFGIELPQFKGTAGNTTELKKQMSIANELAAKFYHNNLIRNTEAEKARDYLKKREITTDICEEYLIGYSLNSTDSLLKYLENEHKISREIMEKAGLIIPRANGGGYLDRFRGRLMIAILDENNTVVGFGARALEEGQKPKYLNSSDTILYNKSKVMFGLNKAKDAIKASDSVIIMEGYFDVISTQVAGIKNVVATSGTSLTQGHLKNLCRYMNEKKIYLAFDSDKAGKMATERGAGVIEEAFEGLGDIKQYDDSFSDGNDFSCEIRVIKAPIGKDPDEFIKTNGVNAYQKLIDDAPLLIDYEIDSALLDVNTDMTPQQKAKKVSELKQILKKVNNAIIRSEYIKKIAKILEIQEDVLFREINSGSKNEKNYSNVKKIVTKSSSKLEIAQKKLLSVYFTNVIQSNIIENLNNLLEEIQFEKGNTLALVSEKLQDMVSVTPLEELQQALLDEFIGNPDAQKNIIEIADMAQELNDMKPGLLAQYVQETFSFIQRCQAQTLQSELKSRYYEVKDDEMASLRIQYEVREKLKQVNKLRLGDINGQEI